MNDLPDKRNGWAADELTRPGRAAELAARNRALQSLNDLAAGLLRLDTAPPVYEAALDGVLGIVGATRGAVVCADDARRCYHLVSQRGYSPATRQAIEQLGYDSPLAHNVARTTRDLVVLYARETANAGQTILSTEGTPVAVLLPLLRRGQVIAILSYVLVEEREVDPGERELLRTAATYIGAALERVQLYEEAAAALRQSESQRALLEALVACTPVGIAFYDRDLHVANLNVEWARLAGVDFPGARDRSLFDLIPDTRSREPALRRVLAGEAVDLRDVPYLLPGQDDPRYYDIQYRPIPDAAGDVTGILCSVVDVTPRYELNEQKDQFIALASHELKTPLTAIKAYAQTALRVVRNFNEPRLVRMLRIIDEQSDRLTRLINDLLDVSYMQTTPLALEREPLDLRDLVWEVAGNLELTAPSFTVAQELPPAPAWVHADMQRIEQVLTNLVQNAIKYSRDSRRIEITVQETDDEVVTSVRDFGMGIPAGQQSQIFQRFFRASNVATRHYTGLGLGLFISHSIVTRHGGRIWLDSHEGVGSTFYFALPRVQP